MQLESSSRGAGQAQELARIQAAYERRDASGATSRYCFTNPGYAFHMQLLEWTLLEAVRRSPVRLEGASVLDVGCGSGYMTSRLLEFGAAATTGVDLMEGRIETAQQRYPRPNFVCANAAELPFVDGEFDIVTQFTCLSSVLDPDLRKAIAAEMWRVIGPGGVIISYDIRRAPWPLRILRMAAATRHRGPALAAPTPTAAISAQEMRRLFPAASSRYASAGLAFDLCPIAGRSEMFARLLAAAPFLREHGFAMLAKHGANASWEPVARGDLS
jgi:ubiquinone/menaquinone biosynthesis C-methylase UbiE